MKVHISSREIIKPSSPTPNHLRIYKFSILDLLAPNFYIPVVLFYSEPSKSAIKICDHLKKSLSETLLGYYQFAGRVKDDDHVDCDDHGAMFIEAQVHSKMSEALEKPNLDMLEQLLPCKTHEKLSPQEVNLAIQVSFFDCGLVAISFSFRHEIADATAATNFVKSFAVVACGLGSSGDVKDVIFDCTSIFPQLQDTSGLSKSVYEGAFPLADTVTKRFTFDSSRIVGLRDKIRIENGPSLDRRPTLVEAVSALIWGAIIAVARDKYRDDSINATNVVTIPVNVRKRMNPPLPEESIGNMSQSIGATWIENTADYNSLAAKIHDAIAMVNEDYARKVNEGGGFLSHFKHVLAEEEPSSSSKMNAFCVSSWCRLPFYEADFGWGKPLWVASGMRLNNIAVLLDTCDGGGIEAWVGCPTKTFLDLNETPAFLLTLLPIQAYNYFKEGQKFLLNVGNSVSCMITFLYYSRLVT